MQVVIRVDASVEIGTGHVMRCYALADTLRQHGVDVIFVMRELPGNMIEFLNDHGFHVKTLCCPDHRCFLENGLEHAKWLSVNWKADAMLTREIIGEIAPKVDWLVVDHYALDYQWESILRPVTRKIFVIDDLYNRSHVCDVLLDQNFDEDLGERYDGLVPKNCRMYMGPSYALLRKEFYTAKKTLGLRNGIVKNILVFMGGTDPSNETLKVLEAMILVKTQDVAYKVIVGKSNPHRMVIRKACESMKNVRYAGSVKDMAAVMAHADLAIGCGGASTWERCFLGLPALLLTVACNQVRVAEAVDAYGAAWNMGKKENVTASDIAFYLEKAIGDPQSLLHMQKKALSLVKQNGLNRLLMDLLGDQDGLEKVSTEENE